MHIYRCHLTLHEPLFYAGREIGRLYETARYLHNYSLAYAFGLAQSPWFHAEQVPHYAADLNPLGEEVYVTPGQPHEIRFQLATFKYGEEVLHVEMQQATRNTPSFGRAKEIAAESSFVCYVISRQKPKLPRWIRLGKWHSKTLVEVEEVPVVEKKRDYRAAVPLNPLDLVESDTLRAFDMISMPPASLVANAYCSGEYYEVGDGYGLPKRMKFQV